MRACLRILFFSALSAAFIGCTSKKEEGATAPSSEADLVNRGRQIYISSCIACHNIDPKKDAAIGPAVFGSSLELVEARVLKAEYPAGYKPKKEGRVMVALPHLKNEIPALHKFLNTETP